MKPATPIRKPAEMAADRKHASHSPRRAAGRLSTSTQPPREAPRGRKSRKRGSRAKGERRPFDTLRARVLGFLHGRRRKSRFAISTRAWHGVFPERG